MFVFCLLSHIWFLFWIQGKFILGVERKGMVDWASALAGVQMKGVDLVYPAK
jgi:hypothetical protein